MHLSSGKETHERQSFAFFEPLEHNKRSRVKFGLSLHDMIRGKKRAKHTASTTRAEQDDESDNSTTGLMCAISRTSGDNTSTAATAKNEKELQTILSSIQDAATHDEATSDADFLHPGYCVNAKLSLLHTLCATVIKLSASERSTLLQWDMLSHLRRWLRPLEEHGISGCTQGTESAVRVIQLLVRVLEQMPVTRAALQTSGGLVRALVTIVEQPLDDQSAPASEAIQRLVQNWGHLKLVSSFDVERTKNAHTGTGAGAGMLNAAQEIEGQVSGNGTDFIAAGMDKWRSRKKLAALQYIKQELKPKLKDQLLTREQFKSVARAATKQFMDRLSNRSMNDHGGRKLTAAETRLMKRCLQREERRAGIQSSLAGASSHKMSEEPAA